MQTYRAFVVFCSFACLLCRIYTLIGKSCLNEQSMNVFTVRVFCLYSSLTDFSLPNHDIWQEGSFHFSLVKLARQQFTHRNRLTWKCEVGEMSKRKCQISGKLLFCTNSSTDFRYQELFRVSHLPLIPISRLQSYSTADFSTGNILAARFPASANLIYYLFIHEKYKWYGDL